MRPFLAALAAIPLSGCAGSVIGDAISGPEAVAAREDAYCQSIGLRFGTPEYANCRMAVGAERQRAHRAAIDSAASGMQRSIEASRPPPRTRCVSERDGNTVITDCQ